MSQTKAQKIEQAYRDHGGTIRGTAWAIAALFVAADVAVVVLAMTPMR